MPLKSVVEIDVDDAKFREFQRNFDQYSEALKNSSSPWAEIAKGTSDAAEALDKMVAKERDANAVAKLTAFAKGRALEVDREQAAAKARADYAALSRMEKLGKGARVFATRMSGAVTHWKSVTGQAKETEARVASVTRLMSGWKALSVIGGLGGVGGSLYGLDRLAGSAAAGRRQSMGTGVPFGKQRAFSLDYSRFGDGDALMGAIGTAKGDATSQQYLGLRGAGLSADEIRRKDAADLGADLFDKLPGLFPRGANDPTFGSSFEARGLGSLMSQEDAKRYLNASPDERQAQRKAYEADSRSMAADPSSLRAWADLDSALGRAKDNIETALVKGLAPLAPQFTTLSGNIATLITDFAKSPEIKSDLDSLASGLGALDKALKDPDSWWNKSGRALDTFSKAEQSWGHTAHDWLHRHAPWATVDHYTGADNPYMGPNADLNRARLRGRSAVDEPEDRKRRAGDKLRAFGGHPDASDAARGRVDAADPKTDAAARGRVRSSDNYTPGGTVPGANGYGQTDAYWRGDLGSAGEGGHLSPASQFSYLKSIGATDNEAVLLTGAASSESSFNPNAKHDPDRFTGAPTGHGLFGHKDTRLDMRGKNWQEQDQAALAEFRRMSVRGVPLSDMLAAAKTPAEIADVEMHYEGPRGYRPNNPRAGDNYMGRMHSIERFQNAFVKGNVTSTPWGAPPKPLPPAIGDKAVLDARTRLAEGRGSDADRDLTRRYREQQNAPAMAPAIARGTLSTSHADDDRASRSRASDVPYSAAGHLSPLQGPRGGGPNALASLYASGLGDKMHRDIVKAHLSNPALERAKKDGAPAKEGKTSTGYVNPIADHYERQKNNPKLHVSNTSGGNLQVSTIAGSFG